MLVQVTWRSTREGGGSERAGRGSEGEGGGSERGREEGVRGDNCGKW